MELIIITGYSGAGKSVALKACEAFGIASMDNIPIQATIPLIESLKSNLNYLVICSDVRSPDFDAAEFLEQLGKLRAHYNVTLLFLSCERNVLLSRFNATKHRHPLFHGDSVQESLMEEEKLMEPLKAVADQVVDTTYLTPYQLKQELSELLGLVNPKLTLTLQSFSYRHGVPAHADLVFDVRFLHNPYYVQALRPLTGRDEKVAAYIEGDEEWIPFMQKLTALLDLLLPLYMKEGKSYLTIAIGCTGGQHRSVYVAETLAKVLKKHNIVIKLEHRELHY